MKKMAFLCRLALLPLIGIIACQPQGPHYSPRVATQHADEVLPEIDFSDQIIYLVMIDRFANGDTSNDRGNTPASHCLYQPGINGSEALKTYQGGDLRGVIDRLDDLHDLGVTTIWLTPVFDNSDQDYRGWWPYHGYHPVDHYRVDEHFGDLADLKELINKAHSREMRVLLDMVLNQVSYDHPWVADPVNWNEKGYKHWFHPHSFTDESTMIIDWDNQRELERKEIARLPDFAQENPQVSRFLLDMSKEWVTLTGCDGFRLDAVRHIPKSFWRRYTREMHNFAGNGFFLIGEVFSSQMDYLAGYGELGFDALFDFSLHFALGSTVANSGSPQKLRDAMAEADRAFTGLPCLLAPFIDNHDVERLISYCQEPIRPRIESALILLFAQPGIPSLYYGTELLLAGGTAQDSVQGDFLNRRNMPWQLQGDESRDLRPLIKKLCNWRRNSPALRKGERTDLLIDQSVYAFLRRDEKETFIIAVNTSDQQVERTLELADAPADGIVRDCLDEQYLSLHGKKLALQIPPYSCRMVNYARTEL